MADLRARLMAAASVLLPGVSAETRVMQSRLQRLAFESELEAKPVTAPQIADLAQLVEKLIGQLAIANWWSKH